MEGTKEYIPSCRNWLKKATAPQPGWQLWLPFCTIKWTHFSGQVFYLLENGEMTVNVYQGPVACQVLEKNKGVCWAAFNKKETMVVDDVHQFPGHIACDSRSNSEIVVPFKNPGGDVIGVLDVDSKEIAAFDKTDVKWLEKILDLIYS
jgi:L-methionine (R)-S-oxide reductase